MRKLTILFLLQVIFCSKFCFSQFNTSTASLFGDPYTNPMWEYYSENMLSTVAAGKGFSGVGTKGDISSICLNPASPEVKKKLQLYAGSTYKSKIYPIQNDKKYFIENGFPSIIAGGICRINKYFHLGVIYRNDLSYKENTQGLSDSINKKFYANGEITNQMVKHNISFPVMYQRERFSVGGNVNVINFRVDRKANFSSPGLPDYYEHMYSTLWKLSFQFGFVVQLTDYFSFGGTYEPGMTEETEWYIEGVEGGINNLVKYPDKLSFGTELSLFKNRLNLTLDYQFENNSVHYDYLKNKSNIHLGIEYKHNKYLTLRTGYFTLYDFRVVPSKYISWSGGATYSYEQFFITAGGSYKFKNISVNLAVMDSHLIVNSFVSHTKINCGLSFDI